MAKTLNTGESQAADTTSSCKSDPRYYHTQDSAGVAQNGNAPRHDIVEDHKLCQIPLKYILVVSAAGQRRIQTALSPKLVRSIEINGIIQPILVRQVKGENKYEIIVGHLRYAACLQLRHDVIDALCIDPSNPEIINIIENQHRSAPDAIWLARELARIKSLTGCTDDVIATFFMCSRGAITQTRSIASLPEDLLDEFSSMLKPPSRGVLIEIAQCGDVDTRLRMIEAVRSGSGTLPYLRAIRAGTVDSFANTGKAERLARQLLKQLKWNSNPGKVKLEDAVSILATLQELDAAIRLSLPEGICSQQSPNSDIAPLN